MISYELKSKLSHIPILDNFSLDENYVQSINSNYFDIPELQKLNDTVSRKQFSLLSTNFDQLLSVLSSSRINFDVIGISEAKQKTGKGCLLICHFCVCQKLEGEIYVLAYNMFCLELEYQFDFLANDFLVPSVLV